jgi:predicted XRE-type DNA-binding protein
MSERMTSQLAVNAISNAISLRRPDATVVHSDRGSQFRSDAFVRTMRDAGLHGSMGRVGACADNAAMKSFFSLLQKNVLNRRRWATREQLRLAIVTWIEQNHHHRRRRQDRLGRLTHRVRDTSTSRTRGLTTATQKSQRNSGQTQQLLELLLTPRTHTPPERRTARRTIPPRHQPHRGSPRPPAEPHRQHSGRRGRDAQTTQPLEDVPERPDCVNRRDPAVARSARPRAIPRRSGFSGGRRTAAPTTQVCSRRLAPPRPTPRQQSAAGSVPASGGRRRPGPRTPAPTRSSGDDGLAAAA